jgi:hypothetical protein
MAQSIRDRILVACLAICAAVVLAVPALAQSSYGPATMVYPTVAGHCLKVGPQGGGYIADSGSACGAGATTPAGSTTQLQYNNAGAFGGISGVTTDGTNLSVVGANFGLSGNISAPAWLTSGVRYKNAAGTDTDTTSSGTVAAAYTNVWGGNTIAASAATTFTQYVSSYFKNPIAGTNVTITGPWALGADSLIINGNILQTGAGTLILGSGGFTATGTIPTVTGTGTPTITTGSTDTAGEVTGGTLATSIVITFAAAKTNAPFCVVTSQSSATGFAYSISTTAITISLSALTAEIVDYHCMQR